MTERRRALTSAVTLMWVVTAWAVPTRARPSSPRPPVIDLSSPQAPTKAGQAKPSNPVRRATPESPTLGKVPREGVAVAQISFVESRVDVQRPGAGWEKLAEHGRVRTGERLRTAADSSARLEFPWMSVSLAPSSVLGLAPGAILGLQLDSGRVELSSGRDDIVKLDTPDARVRGQGWVIVRRDTSGTQVSVLRGEFRVGTIALLENQGCTVAVARGLCKPVALPTVPAALAPGADPRYVSQGQGVALTWNAAPEAAGYFVQVLSFDDDALLLQHDVAAAAHEVRVPWLGLYRWRVSARNAAGIEGPPSLEGLFCVMPGRWLEGAPQKPAGESLGRRQRERTAKTRGVLENPSSPDALTANTRQ